MTRIFFATCLGLMVITLIYTKDQFPYNSSEKPTIIMDLGGVLVETNRLSVFWALRPTLLFSYWMSTKKSLHSIKDTFYDMLNAIDESSKNSYGAKDFTGQEIPALMSDWLAGTKTGDQIQEMITEFIHKKPTWFANKIEAELMQSFARVIFNPKLFINTIRLTKHAIPFLQLCKKLGYRIVILSNWDPESFTLLKQKYPNLFSLCDDIIISGSVHSLKPHCSIFNEVIRKFDPASCIFIDDQPENRAMAEQIGIKTISCIKNYQSLDKKKPMIALAKKVSQWKNEHYSSIAA
jgi:FMN phosphatase YigB (HAD superfamily)